jgi:hypothetical protein
MEATETRTAAATVAAARARRRARLERLADELRAGGYRVTLVCATKIDGACTCKCDCIEREALPHGE